MPISTKAIFFIRWSDPIPTRPVEFIMHETNPSNLKVSWSWFSYCSLANTAAFVPAPGRLQVFTTRSHVSETDYMLYWIASLICLEATLTGRAVRNGCSCYQFDQGMSKTIPVQLYAIWRIGMIFYVLQPLFNIKIRLNPPYNLNGLNDKTSEI